MRSFVFISYNHKDVRWAKWLRRKLEWYRLPSEIHNEIENSRYIRPVFRDRDELSSGILNDELKQRLESSKFLVVICSPNSARSKWVSDEIRAFIKIGREEFIIPFVVEGGEECFPDALKEWNESHSERQLLGINVVDDGKHDKQKSFIRLVSRLLDVRFDSLWKRHKRALAKGIAVCVAAVALVAWMLYWFAVPVRMSVRVMDEPSSLPGFEKAVLTVNGSEYAISGLDTVIEVNRLPGFWRLRDTEVGFKADRYYRTENMNVEVTSGTSQVCCLQLHRDQTFAFFGGRVIDEEGETVSGATVTIDGKHAETDAEGRFRIQFKVSEQTVYKEIRIDKDGYKPLMREDECPGEELTLMLRK